MSEKSTSNVPVLYIDYELIRVETNGEVDSFLATLKRKGRFSVSRALNKWVLEFKKEEDAALFKLKYL